MQPVVAIVGPTATGKSNLALRIAQNIDYEIVSADSRQVYRYMDIGTAKSSKQELASIPHHLVDVVNPDEDFTLAQFQNMALSALSDIHSRGKLPLVVGGSGLYIRALLEGWAIPHVQPDIQLRQKLEARANTEGGQALFQELQEIDPKAAEKIDPHNVRRVIRALEVYHLTGRPFSSLQKKNPPDLNILTIGLTMEREELYGRIDSRVDEMFQQGFIEEVRDLIEKGYSLDLPSMASIGYRQIGMLLNEEMDRANTIQRIKYETHRIARHQYAWFRPNDQNIHWLNSNEQDIYKKVLDLVIQMKNPH